MTTGKTPYLVQAQVFTDAQVRSRAIAQLAHRLASTFVAFAKNGNPDNDQIRHWPAYHGSTRATMLFDADTCVENDPRRAIRQYWSRNAESTQADD